LENLPFQPEEEETLTSIIETAQAFRDYIRPYVNPLTVSPDEVTTLRFYLRKVEGADILLAYETNFLRQELHKSAPVAPEAPPVIDSSSSTRKPRPTKQQKLMASLGISNPDDLPPQYKIKPHKRKGSEAQHLAAGRGTRNRPRRSAILPKTHLWSIQVIVIRHSSRPPRSACHRFALRTSPLILSIQHNSLLTTTHLTHLHHHPLTSLSRDHHHITPPCSARA
jgi:hypothetical protein